MEISSVVLRFVALLALALGACRAARDAAPVARDQSSQTNASPVAREPQVPPAPTREPRVLVAEGEALALLERAGADLARLAFRGRAPAPHNAALAELADYRAVRDVLARDVDAIAARDPQAGVSVRGHAHRLFDLRWLASDDARFELVAVVNRMDRHFFHPRSCGEVRFVYRLAYARDEGGARLASRLPLTVGVEIGAEEEGDGAARCQLAAQRWLLPPAIQGRALAAALTAPEGPLAPERLASARVLRVVTNMQTVRWPAAVRPDLGGHAEYALRTFVRATPTSPYRPGKLENTPDVARLARDPGARVELLRWLREPSRLADIDRGLVTLPEAFLAEVAVSVTPRGLARRANRPFRSLFSPADFASLELAGLRFAKSPEALVRRLDDLSCSGCHQSRSIAGFHQLGEDAADGVAGNALATGSSPHVVADLPRRRAYVAALARGATTDLARPLAERADDERGGYGAHCGLGDPGFASWTCDDGLRCDSYEAAAGERTVGVCLPEALETGDPCEPAQLRWSANGERVVAAAARACPYVCERTRVGFPGGMCASPCAPLPGEAACGGIAVLTPFNACLAERRPFSECVRDHVRPAGLRRCSAEQPCRDDYVCARAEEGGVCLPPYFVFQMRVDGHPSP